MFTLLGGRHRPCDGVSRRHFLKVGALGGLSLANVLRLQAQSPAPQRPKSVIMVYLPGGPSHIDMYDMKPDAPAEVRGPFKPIRSNVPGLDVCELMPLQAQIADKFSILRGLQSCDVHSAEMLMRGMWAVMAPPPAQRRPVFGSIVSKLRGSSNAQGMPTFVSMGAETTEPEYLGPAHKPFRPSGPGLENLSLHRSVDGARLADRKELLKALDGMNRAADNRARDLAGIDEFNARALDMITTRKAREAFDISKEPAATRERFDIRDQYGVIGNSFLMARRLVEAGVSVVTMSAAFYRGDWDDHGKQDGNGLTLVDSYKGKLPLYDRCVHALITDLHERGLADDVAVVLWGEFGRAPKMNEIAGRHHWPMAGHVLFSGGGLKMGQVAGDTGPRGDRERGRSTPYTPQNVLATLYGVLGIDPTTTLPDFAGRPMYLLDDPEPIKEFV